MKKLVTMMMLMAMVALVASSAQATLVNAPISTWKFNEGTGAGGTTVYDSVGSNNATLVDTNSSSSWVAGDPTSGETSDYGLDLVSVVSTPSTHDHLTVADDDSLDFITSIEMECYIKPDSSMGGGGSTARKLVSKLGAYEFTVRSTRNQFLMIFKFSDDSVRTHTIGRTATADVWSHIRFRWDGTDTTNNSQFWLNGTLGYQQQLDYGKTLAVNDAAVGIGARVGGADAYTGAIDDLSITPEPATMTLLLLGLPFALRRRR